MRGKHGVEPAAGREKQEAVAQWAHELESMGRAFCQLGERMIAVAGSFEQSMQAGESWDVGPERGQGDDNHTPWLTRCERETLGLYARGMSAEAIAQARGVRLSTVREQTKSARAKLEVASTAQAAAKARQLGLI